MDLTVPFLMVHLIGQLFKRKKKKRKGKGSKKARRGCDPTGCENFPSTRLFLVCLVLFFEYQEAACWLPKTCLSRQNRRIRHPAWITAGFFRAQPPAILQFVLADVFLISLNLCKIVVLKLIISTIRKLCY